MVKKNRIRAGSGVEASDFSDETAPKLNSIRAIIARACGNYNCVEAIYPGETAVHSSTGRFYCSVRCCAEHEGSATVTLESAS